MEKILANHSKNKEIFDYNTGYTPGKKSNTKSRLLVVEIFFLDKDGEVNDMYRIGKFKKKVSENYLKIFENYLKIEATGFCNLKRRRLQAKVWGYSES